MAETPERPINQSLPRKTTTAISILKRLLDDPPNESCAFYFKLPEVLMQEIARVKLPAFFADSLNFNALAWTSRGSPEHSVSRLCIGKMDDTHAKNDVGDALATIEIAARRISIEKIIPTYLRIAWVDEKQNRIGAAAWDPEDQNRLVELNVSLSNDEYGDIAKYLPATYINKTTASIPTNKDNLYETAGLITEAMCNAVDHDKVLIIKFNNGSAITKLPSYCYIKKAGEIVTVGLEDNDAKTICFKKPWEISVPEFLQKA